MIVILTCLRLGLKDYEYMSDLSHLNDKQQEAVLTTEGPLLVLAGAGSGKTRVLTERCAHIIRNGTPPWAVLAITFTNKAAGEIKERLNRILSSSCAPDAPLDATSRCWAMTFHAMCVRFLRRDITALGYKTGFTIYDTDDSKRVMKEVLKTLNYDEKRVNPQAVLAVIGRAKDAEQNADKLLASAPDDFLTKVTAECYALYQKRLFEANALDFDDILALTVRLFREHPGVLHYYQRRFSYILVDEYQDTNKLQYQLVSMLAAGHRNLCVVGDDDQSIYGFRGATIENILHFERHYPEAKVIRLEQNYRSTGSILGAANRVISHNLGRKGKTLYTESGQGEPVKLITALNENDEARFISETVLNGVATGANFRDWCVLYRMNAQSSRVESQLRLSGVPYKVVGGMRFYDRAEVKDMMAYLQIIHNPSDDLRLMRILNVPPRGVGAKAMAVIRALAARDGVSCFDVADQSDTYPELTRLSAVLKAFAATVRAWGLASETLPLAMLYDDVLERSGYVRMLQDKDDDESRGRLENIYELKTNIAQYQEDAVEPALGGFLDDTALFTDLDKYIEEDNAVTLMTIHASKGLEFPTVFLAGMEEGIFPGIRSAHDPFAIEEERRLCYVGVTRARERLFVLCAAQRMLYGQTTHNFPSRFIEEMGLTTPTLTAAPLQRGEWGRAREKSSHPGRGAAERRGGSSAPKITINKGDAITHKRFGNGVVLTVTPMGNDAMLEIAFDEGGTRKLMQNFAGAFMTKR
jgi:DNA helicase-2/ATP-dependent DNA helicase PcrA